MNSPEKVSGVEYDTEQESRNRVVIQPQPIIPTQFEVPKNIHFSTITQLKNSLNLSNLDTSSHFNNENINIYLTQNELNELKNEIDKLSTNNSKIKKIKEITTSQAIVIDQSKTDRITLQKEIKEKLNNFVIANVKSNLDTIEKLKDPQEKAFLTNFLLGVLEGKGYSITLNDNKIEVNSDKQGSLKDELKILFNNYIESRNFDINTFKNAILYRTTTLDNYVAANTDGEGKLIVDKMNSKTYYDFLLKKYNLDAKFWPSNIEDIKNHPRIREKDKVFMISYYQKSFEGFPIDQSIKQFKEKEVQVANHIASIPQSQKVKFVEDTKIIDDRSINQRTGDFLRDPFREINLIMGKAGGIGGLAILGSIIYFMFKKPKEIFGGIAVWGLLKGLGVMDEIGNTFDGDYNESIAKGSKKAFDWAEEKFKKIPGIDINFSSNLIERGKDWFNFKDVKIGNGDDAKSVIDTDFTDLYNISEKNELKDKLFIGKNNIGDKKIKALKGKLEELYNKGIGVYESKDKFFDVIQGKNIMEVEKIIFDKEVESKKGNPNNNTQTSLIVEKSSINPSGTTTEKKQGLQEKKDDTSIKASFFTGISGSLATVNFDSIKSKIGKLSDYTQEGVNKLNDEISKIVSSDEYKNLTNEAKQKFNDGIVKVKETYQQGINKSTTGLFESFIAGLGSNVSSNQIDSYLGGFKSKFSNISSYSGEQLSGFMINIEAFKKGDKYTTLSEETKTKIDSMLAEVQTKYEEKFKNMLTVLGEKLDMDNVDKIELNSILTDSKTYSKEELQNLTAQIKNYKETEKFNGLEQPQKIKITTFLDNSLIKYNEKLFNQEKKSFSEKIISSQTELINKFNEFADKNNNYSEEPGEKQRLITEFNKKLQEKIIGLDIDKVADIDGLEKLIFEYKLFGTILNSYLDGTKKGDITKFIDGYVFNDVKPYELGEAELLELVRGYDFKGLDYNDFYKKNNGVFNYINHRVNNRITSIPDSVDLMMINLYKKYISFELKNSLDILNTPIGSITINDINTHFKPKNFTDWKKEMIG